MEEEEKDGNTETVKEVWDVIEKSKTRYANTLEEYYDIVRGANKKFLTFDCGGAAETSSKCDSNCPKRGIKDEITDGNELNYAAIAAYYQTASLKYLLECEERFFWLDISWKRGLWWSIGVEFIRKYFQMGDLERCGCFKKITFDVILQIVRRACQLKKQETGGKNPDLFTLNALEDFCRVGSCEGKMDADVFVRVDEILDEYLLRFANLYHDVCVSSKARFNILRSVETGLSGFRFSLNKFPDLLKFLAMHVKPISALSHFPVICDIFHTVGLNDTTFSNIREKLSELNSEFEGEDFPSDLKEIWKSCWDKLRRLLTDCHYLSSHFYGVKNLCDSNEGIRAAISVGKAANDRGPDEEENAFLKRFLERCEVVTSDRGVGYEKPDAKMGETCLLTEEGLDLDEDGLEMVWADRTEAIIGERDNSEEERIRSFSAEISNDFREILDILEADDEVSAEWIEGTDAYAFGLKNVNVETREMLQRLKSIFPDFSMEYLMILAHRYDRAEERLINDILEDNLNPSLKKLASRWNDKMGAFVVTDDEEGGWEDGNEGEARDDNDKWEKILGGENKETATTIPRAKRRKLKKREESFSDSGSASNTDSDQYDVLDDKDEIRRTGGEIYRRFMYRKSGYVNSRGEKVDNKPESEGDDDPAEYLRKWRMKDDHDQDEEDDFVYNDSPSDDDLELYHGQGSGGTAHGHVSNEDDEYSKNAPSSSKCTGKNWGKRGGEGRGFEGKETHGGSNVKKSEGCRDDGNANSIDRGRKTDQRHQQQQQQRETDGQGKKEECNKTNYYGNHHHQAPAGNPSNRRGYRSERVTRGGFTRGGRGRGRGGTDKKRGNANKNKDWRNA